MVDLRMDQLWDIKNLSLGALASNDVVDVKSDLDEDQKQRFHIIKMRIFADLIAKTIAEGPILFGVGMNVTAARVELMLEEDRQGQLDPRPSGSLSWMHPLALIHRGEENYWVMNGGNTVEINPNWTVDEDGALIWWAYNTGGGALTAGSAINVRSQIFGRWLRD